MDNPDAPSLFQRKKLRAEYMRAYIQRPDVQARRKQHLAKFRAQNRQALAEAQRKRYQANHAVELEKRRITRAARRNEIREYNRVYQREWRAKNPEKVKAAAKRFAATDYGRHVQVDLKGKRRARKQGTQVAPINWKQVWSRFNGICPLCQKALYIGVHIFHFDHIVALARGGSHSTDNLQVTHAVCNLKKNRYPFLWPQCVATVGLL